MLSFVERTLEMGLCLTHGTEKEGRAGWAVGPQFYPPPTLDRPGWSRA